ncbi:hypothetical protein Pelo_8016 [Pelomyxa schiedti]|nr:hypothetical protein Pelo_8016 [Pelomyxa schiedti]
MVLYDLHKHDLKFISYNLFLLQNNSRICGGVRALPSTALKPNHNETDDFNIAHFKQTISRKMLRQAGRDQESSDVMKLSEAITAGLLDAWYSWLCCDGWCNYCKILPLIAEVKRAKANEDWEKNILWNYNSMVYGKQGYSEGLVSLDAFLGQCVFTLEECHTMKLADAVQKEKCAAELCFLTPSLHGHNFTSGGTLEQLTTNGCDLLLLSIDLYELLKPNIVLIASKNLKIPAGGPCKKGTQVAVMQFYCRDGLQQHFHILEAFKGNTLKVDVDQRLVHYLPAASPIEPMLRLN